MNGITGPEADPIMDRANHNAYGIPANEKNLGKLYGPKKLKSLLMR